MAITNYEARFNKIVKRIGDKERIEGIGEIFRGAGNYFMIRASGIEITRGSGYGLREIRFTDESSWEVVNNFSDVIEAWFRCVEDAIAEAEEEEAEESEKSSPEIVLNGVRYKRID